MRIASRHLSAILISAGLLFMNGVARAQSDSTSAGFGGLKAELHGKVVTGAPFTASFSTQTTQIFSDGNKIQQESSAGTIARDSEGRTRRDMTLNTIVGLWTSNNEGTSKGAAPDSTAPIEFKASFINDPVAKTHYILFTDRKLARQVGRHAGMRNGSSPNSFGEMFKGETTTESLGTQTINGVPAQGTRFTRTIPAGQIGNEKPIVIVIERWYSPDLQMVVMTKHTDPRSGETEFQLTNIVRQEPAASLFQVPSDYTIKQGRH
jgi:hypothetical protein